MKFSIVQVAVMGVLAAASAHGQEGAEAKSGSSLGEIVVTAQRRAENIQDVPISVTAVSADALADRHFTDPSQLQFVAPNVQFTSFAVAPGATNFSVRGIGTFSFSHIIEPSVATVIDDVVMGRPEMGIMKFSDLERIEVLSGPQGMLFGKNAVAGLINIVTRKPQLGENTVSAHGEIASVRAADKCCSYVLQSTANFATGERSALRMNAFYDSYTDLVKDRVKRPGNDYGHEQYGARVQFLAQPTDALTILFSGEFAHGAGMGTGATSARNSAPGGFIDSLDQLDGIVPGPKNVYRSASGLSDVSFDLGGGKIQIDYELDGGQTLTNILAYRKYKANHSFDGDYHSSTFFDSPVAYFDFDQITEELRLTSASGGTVEYQFGLYYYKANSNRDDRIRLDLGITPGAGPPPGGALSWGGNDALNNLDTKSLAAYGQWTVRLADKFRVTAGGRYTRDELDIFQNVTSPYPIPFFAALEETNSVNNNDFSWRLSAQYDFTPDVMAYATVARGYKGPGFNLSYNASTDDVGPERSMNYEVGIKSQISDSVMFNLSAYWETIKNLQVQALDVERLAYQVVNAGSLRARGFEADLRISPVADLLFSLQGTFNDAEFTSFRGAPCYNGQTVQQGCLPVTPTANASDATGNRLLNAPKVSGTLAVDYSHAAGSSLRAFYHADLYARSKVNFHPSEDPFMAQKGYAITNASVGFGKDDGSWKVSLFCRNCFDQRFVTFIEPNPAGVPGDYGQTFGLTSFRTFGMSFDVSF